MEIQEIYFNVISAILTVITFVVAVYDAAALGSGDWIHHNYDPPRSQKIDWISRITVTAVFTVFNKL